MYFVMCNFVVMVACFYLGSSCFKAVLLG